jgi:hypothetical protein
VHDFQGEKFGPADARERELLESKTTVAPVRYQKAFLAHPEFENWNPKHERFAISHAQRRVVPV